jgi:hypothetical protein
MARKCCNKLSMHIARSRECGLDPHNGVRARTVTDAPKEIRQPTSPPSWESAQYPPC